MKTEIDETGIMAIAGETKSESCALQRWFNENINSDNNIKTDHLKIETD